MRRTTPARSARDARRPARGVHLRAASVIALAALGVGVAPAVAAPLAGDDPQQTVATAGTSSESSDSGGDESETGQPTSENETPTEDATGEAQDESSNDPDTDQTTDDDDQSDENDDDATDKNNDPSTPPVSSPSTGDSGNSTPPSEHTRHPRAKVNPSNLDVSDQQTATLSIWGFTPDTAVTVTAPDGVSAGSPTVTTGTHGGARVKLDVDPSLKNGEYTITAASQSQETASATLTVKSPEESATPSITVASETVQAGDSVKVDGAHFPSDSEVSVSVADSQGKRIGEATHPEVGTDGDLSSSIAIPSDTPADKSCTVTATTKSGEKATAPVSVTASDGGGSGSDTPTTDNPTSDTPSSPSKPSTSTTPPSSSSTDDGSATTSTSPSTTPSDSGSSSASTTSEVPPATSTRDRSKEIELSAPSDDSSSQTQSEEPEKKDASEKPTKDEDSEKAKDEDKKTSETPQETSDQPVSAQQDDATEAAATMEDNTTTSGPTTVTTEDDGGGPLVKLFSSIGGEDASGMDRIRQVFIATLGVGFLTAMGFTAASWLSRRSGTHSARAGLRQLFHRRH